MSNTRDEHVFLAKVAEQAGRYQGAFPTATVIARHSENDLVDMLYHIKEVASMQQELTFEERNLLSIAYKMVVGARRVSWRIITSIEAKELSKGNSLRIARIKNYRERIEGEPGIYCDGLFTIIDEYLIKNATLPGSKVFYYKM